MKTDRELAIGWLDDYENRTDRGYGRVVIEDSLEDLLTEVREEERKLLTLQISERGWMPIGTFSPITAHCCDKTIMEIIHEFKKPISPDELKNVHCQLKFMSRVAIECPVCKLWLVIGAEGVTARYSVELTPVMESLSK